eukprot:1994034-Prymnesium_polylepis.1
MSCVRTRAHAGASRSPQAFDLVVTLKNGSAFGFSPPTTQEAITHNGFACLGVGIEQATCTHGGLLNGTSGGCDGSPGSQMLPKGAELTLTF